MISNERLDKINSICPGFPLYEIGNEIRKGVIAFDSIAGGGAIAVAYTRYIEFKQTFSPVALQVDYQLTGNENGTLMNSTWAASNIYTLDGVTITGTNNKPIYNSSIPFVRSLITGTVDTNGLVTLNAVPNGNFIIRYKYKLADGVYVDNYDPEDVLRPNEYDIEMLGTKIIATPETPSNYAPVQTGSEGDDKLSAHLKGIDNKFGNIPYPVTSVNSETGDVALDADDIDDSATTNKFTNDTEKSEWDSAYAHSEITDGNPHGINKTKVGLSNVTNDAQLKRAAGDINSFTGKTSPVLADLVLIEDSADGNNKKKIQLQNIPSIKEVFIAGTDYNANIGYFRVRNVANTGAYRWVFKVPSDFTELVSIELICIVSSGAAGIDRDIDIYSEYGNADEWEIYNNHAESNLTTLYNFAGMANRFYKFDLSIVLSRLSARDACGILMDHKGIGGALDYIGINFKYKARS